MHSTDRSLPGSPRPAALPDDSAVRFWIDTLSTLARVW